MMQTEWIGDNDDDGPLWKRTRADVEQVIHRHRFQDVFSAMHGHEDLGGFSNFESAASMLDMLAEPAPLLSRLDAFVLDLERDFPGRVTRESARRCLLDMSVDPDEVKPAPGFERSDVVARLRSAPDGWSYLGFNTDECSLMASLLISVAGETENWLHLPEHLDVLRFRMNLNSTKNTTAANAR